MVFLELLPSLHYQVVDDSIAYRFLSSVKYLLIQFESHGRVSFDGSTTVVWREEAWGLQLLLDVVSEDLHLLFLAVDQKDVARFEVGQELHDAFRVSVGAETHVEDLQVYCYVSTINLDGFFTREYFVTDCSWHAVAGYDDSVFGIWCPFFESLERETAMKHTWSSEEDHGFISLKRLGFELLHV